MNPPVKFTPASYLVRLNPELPRSVRPLGVDDPAQNAPIFWVGARHRILPEAPHYRKTQLFY